MTQVFYSPGTDTTPRWVGANVEQLLATRGRPDRLKRILRSSLVPMLLVDSERRYVEVNTPAMLAFRAPQTQLRGLKIDDLTPTPMLPTLKEAWGRLMSTGCVAGPYSVASPDGSRLEVAYYAVRDALPGLHLIAFAPLGWPDEELANAFQPLPAEGVSPLTARELEVLELAAEGRNAPAIANELTVSAATVRTHFGHIYEKLGVSDRAAAVAKAMRLGMIA